MEFIVEFLSNSSIGTILVVGGIGLFIASFFKKISLIEIIDAMRVPARISGVILIIFGTTLEYAKAPNKPEAAINQENLISLTKPAEKPSSYVIHVHTMTSQSMASVTHDKMRKKYGKLLDETLRLVEPIKIEGKGTVYRVTHGPFTSKEKADQICLFIIKDTGYCAVLPFGNSVVIGQ